MGSVIRAIIVYIFLIVLLDRQLAISGYNLGEFRSRFPYYHNFV